MPKQILPPLTPIISNWIKELVNNPEFLEDVIEEHGSPINMHNALPFRENYKLYQEVFDEFGLDNLVFFARKANKCRSLVLEAKKLGMGIDTASYRELKEALEAGLDSKKLVVTAAVKERKLIELAVKNEVLIILDNEDECKLTQQVAEKLNIQAQIGLRISGFNYRGAKLYSRFGFDIDGVFNFIIKNVGKHKAFNSLNYQGLHFHLNGYSTEQRGEACIQSFELAMQLKTKGFETQFLDIGGGFLMNYLSDKNEWESFKETLQLAVKQKVSPITFQNDGLGYQVINDELHGELKTYPYFNEKPKGLFLREILSYKNKNSNTVAELAKKLNIQIRMEPGRSMLDQVGYTMAKVVFRKKDSQNNWLVGLEMNFTQMHSSSADYLMDPIVLFKDSESKQEQCDVFFTGAYCLERDILLKRKIALKQLPQIGDLVIFPNTAGYMMHFFESEAHLFDLAANVWFETGGSKTSSKFVHDDEFNTNTY
ncbi:Y4yA family PLP-dependent enzyme [Chondrinema litorale]|uniref:Y4yA family PLP-dependent enzyme n=1 Tax=Chondrinema litorale TaxID=2994555 RepID=UPI002542A1DD|nr:Y4yA family PLP-dependent enzyme [Chondrinema litorale]UZR98492.1 Y4yA family PLP-dependent enzyme [Chondrinema litorale]